MTPTDKDFNDPGSDLYKVYLGDYKKFIPQMVAQGRRPLTVYEYMERRANAPRVVVDIRHNINDSAWTGTFATADTFHFLKDGSGYLVRQDSLVLSVDKCSAMNNYDLSLPQVEQRAESLFLPKSRVDQIHEREYTLAEILESPEWLFLAREDRNLLKENVNLNKEWGREKFLSFNFYRRPSVDVLRPIYFESTYKNRASIDHASIVCFSVGKSSKPSHQNTF